MPGKMRDRAQAPVGEVGRRERQGDGIQARVQGTRPAPHRVRINLSMGEVVCSCPDEYNAVCKHTAATLLDPLHDLSPDTAPDWARGLTHAAEEESWE